MRQIDVSLRRVRQKLEKGGWLDAKGNVRGDLAWEPVWQLMGRQQAFEARQRWLVKAGWDPGGWVFLNWNQLPRELKLDLVLNYLTVEEAQEERLKAEKNNRNDYSMSEGEAVQQ